MALSKNGNKSDFAAESIDVDIIKRARQLRKKRINIQFNKDQKLSTKLVKELNLDILFSSKIW
jgi:hypothetical protein